MTVKFFAGPVRDPGVACGQDLQPAEGGGGGQDQQQRAGEAGQAGEPRYPPGDWGPARGSPGQSGQMLFYFHRFFFFVSIPIKKLFFIVVRNFQSANAPFLTLPSILDVLLLKSIASHFYKCFLAHKINFVFNNSGQFFGGQ